MCEKGIENLGFVDKIIQRVSSRKLLVWLTASGLLFFDKFTSDNWLYISLVYIGSQAAVDIVEKLKSGGQK
jgi:hypothetical protein